MNKKLNDMQMNYLDVVRIVAALFVLVGHSLSFFQLLGNGVRYPHIQSIAVVIFFLLSGFLSAYSLNLKRELSYYTLSDYIKHKIFRIEKECILGLLFVILVDIISIHVNGKGYHYYDNFNFKQFLGNILFLNGTTINHFLSVKFVPFGSLRPIWTLPIDFWLCIVFAVLYFAIVIKRKIEMKDILMFVVSLFFCVEHIVGVKQNSLGFVYMLGIFSYYIYDIIDDSISNILFIISIFIYIYYSLNSIEAYSLFSYLILFSIFTFGLNVNWEKLRVRKNGGGYSRSGALIFLSKCTFMLYLIHYSIIEMIARSSWQFSKYLKLFLGIFFSIVCSIFLFSFANIKKVKKL